MDSANGSAAKLFQGLQVRPHDTQGYRSGMTAYRVTQNTRTAYGYARANTEWGDGGLEQIVIPDYHNVLEPLYSVPLH